MFWPERGEKQAVAVSKDRPSGSPTGAREPTRTLTARTMPHRVTLS